MVRDMSRAKLMQISVAAVVLVAVASVVLGARVTVVVGPETAKIRAAGAADVEVPLDELEERLPA